MSDIDDDLRTDSRFERALFVRLLVILLVVAAAVVARALFL
jgi:hypothetical protein